MNGGSGLSRATFCAVLKICSAVYPPGMVGAGDGNGDSIVAGCGTPESGSTAKAGAAATIATATMAAYAAAFPGPRFIALSTQSLDVWIQIRKRTVRIRHKPEAEIPTGGMEMRPEERRARRQDLVCP